MIAIVGLGNPGDKYKNTRHNLGFIIVDTIFKDSNPFINKFSGLFKECRIEEKKVIIFKPQTFMNLSGQALYQLKNNMNLENKNIIVIYDDIDLPFGKLRIRNKGSSGGHNGIKSIISAIGEDFIRFRVGVDKPANNLNDYVLSEFNKNEFNKLKNIMPNIEMALKGLIKNDSPEEVINVYNRII